jgi:hypothetical protein
MSSKFNVVPAKETCAIWNIGETSVRGALVEIDSGKTVRIVRQWERLRGGTQPSGKLHREFLESFRHIPIVVSLDSPLAYTAILPFKIVMKEDRREDKIEFHNTLRDLVNRSNLETRLLAAKALGVEDLDAVLFDARVVGLTIDGKEVAGWPDLMGKKLEGSLHVMFTTRAIFQELHEIIHSRKELFMTEEGKAALAVLEKQFHSPIRLMRVWLAAAEFMVLDRRHSPVLKKMPFSWESPITMLMDEWQLSEDAARRILEAVVGGKVSGAVKRVVSKMIDTSAEAFHHALERSKFQGTIYIREDGVLPFGLPHHYGGVNLEAYPFGTAWRELGFSNDPASFSEEEVSLLSPFLEYYYHRGDPAHHHALARQIHWIAP